MMNDVEKIIWGTVFANVFEEERKRLQNTSNCPEHEVKEFGCAEIAEVAVNKYRDLRCHPDVEYLECKPWLNDEEEVVKEDQVPGKEKYMFQAVVVRYRPNAISNERLNIGVALLCSDLNFSEAKFLKSWDRISNTFPQSDAEHLQTVCEAISISVSNWIVVEDGSKVIDDIGDYFDALIVDKEGSIQRSPVMRGITLDPKKMLDEIFCTFVEGCKKANVVDNGSA